MEGFSKKATLIFSILLLNTLAVLAVPGSSVAQITPRRNPAKELSDSTDVASSVLGMKSGKNKKIPAAYRKQILYALSFFPELTNTKINFQVKKSTGGIISTRPTTGSLLKRSSKRTYIVVINDSIKGRTLPTFANCNVDGQVGILGHELCHIVDFNSMTGFGLARLGASHISRSYLDKFEYRTDSMNIERGLGYQLLAWKQYLDKEFKTMRGGETVSLENPKMHNRYMSVEQIRRVISKSKVYQQPR